MKNNTTPACLDNQTTKQMYRDLIRQTLLDNDVKSIICADEKEPYFDKIEVNADGTMTVTKYGNLTFDNLYFDYTCDFARCLSYIEDAIFMQGRGGKVEHGMTIEFNA